MIYEDGEFGIFPAKILKGLHPNKQILIAWLIFHTNSQTGKSFPSLALLSKETGIRSRTTLIAYLSELEKEGFIRKKTRRRDDGGNTSNEYEVFIKRLTSCSNYKQGTVQKVDTNYKKINQKNYNIELFEKCWVAYERKGNKQIALRYWKKLSTDDQQSVNKFIPAYIKSREYKYRKDFQGWVNPANRMWEDEIEEEKIRRISI